MIEWSVLPIEFGQGITTKPDPKKIPSGKFLRLENGVFTKINQVSKRNGYSAFSSSIIGGGNLVAPTLVHSFQNQLICADQGNLYSWSVQVNKWSLVGPYTSIETSVSPIDESTQGSGAADSVVNGGYILYAWSASNNAVSDVYFSVVDQSTGALIYQSPSVSTMNTGAATNNLVRALVLGSSTLAIVYIKADTSAVVLRTISISSGVVTYSSENTITSHYGYPANGNGAFDIVNTSAGGAILYPTAANGPNQKRMSLAPLNTSGTVSGPIIVVEESASIFLGLCHLSQTANGYLWCYYQYMTGTPAAGASAGSLRYAVFDSLLASVVAAKKIVDLASPYIISNISALTVSVTAQNVYFGCYVQSGTDDSSVIYSGDFTQVATVVNSGLVSSTTTFVNGIMPYSRPFTYGSFSYAIYCYRGPRIITNATVLGELTSETTFFIIQLGGSSAVAVGRFAQGIADSLNTFQIVTSYTPNLSPLSSSKFIFPCGRVVQAASSASFFSSVADSVGIVATFSYQFELNGISNYVAVDSAQLTILNGAVLSAFDGKNVSELGFHLFPEIIGTTQVGMGGSIEAGVYYYQAIFHWTDAQGNLHQSEPSVPFKVTVTNASSVVTIYISTAYLTQKPNVSVVISRTQKNTTSATVYYNVVNPTQPLYGNNNSISVNFPDSLSDAQILGNTQAYTYPSSAVLANTASAPSTIILNHNNRLWYVDAENPNQIWYTKSFNPGNGLSPCASLIADIDPKLGNISALAEMDEKLMIFKTSGICGISGDGADDTGSNTSLSFPQFIPSDVGCDQPRSVVLMPTGVLFHSPNGIYAISRKLEVSYIGQDVEQYNSQTITSATFIQGKSQIRFLCSSGFTLVYDYIFNQWATFTNHTGSSASSWMGNYVYVNGSTILKETPGVYSDNGSAIALLLQTGWLSISSIQNFQRVRRFISLGDFINGGSSGHGVSVAAAYDFSTSFQSAISYFFGAASASGVFQYRERLPIQKCDSISLLITELTTGSSAEYIDFTNMSFEAGLKKGLNKLGASYSVG